MKCLFGSLAVALFAFGCANNAKPVTTHDADEAAAPVSETKSNTGAVTALQPEKPEPMTMPTACSADSAVCTPPPTFVKRMCKTTTPDLALTMFHKSSPWTRAYVRSNMEAWYASARRSQPRNLRYSEEVIIVADRSASPGGMQVSGTGSYDVYRFDGTCVSLMTDEVSLRRPATPDVAPIRFKRLDDNVQELLRSNTKIGFRYTKRREACKQFGEQAARRCERANVSLSRMVAEYVRTGGEVPEPKLGF
jgi:hypothetical protein